MSEVSWRRRGAILVAAQAPAPEQPRVIDVHSLIACPTCHARATERCRNPGGTTRGDHINRLISVRCICGDPVEYGCLSCSACRVERRRETWREGQRRSRAHKKGAA